MNVLESIADAKAYIDENFNSGEAKVLFIADSLQDPVGVNMAVILDRALKYGYFPNGFEQKTGYRIYKYTKD